MIGQFQWINGYEDKHSNPVYKHAKNPNKWDISADRFTSHIMVKVVQ